MAENTSEQRQDVFAELAARHGVSAEIHPLDYALQFFFDNQVLASREDPIRYYFDDGADYA